MKIHALIVHFPITFVAFFLLGECSAHLGRPWSKKIQTNLIYLNIIFLFLSMIAALLPNFIQFNQFIYFHAISATGLMLCFFLLLKIHSPRLRFALVLTLTIFYIVTISAGLISRYGEHYFFT